MNNFYLPVPYLLTMLENTWTKKQTFNQLVTHNANIRMIDNTCTYWSASGGGNVYAFKGPDDYGPYGNLIFDDGINVPQQTNIGLPPPTSSYPGVIFRYDLRAGNPSSLPTLSANGQWYIILEANGATGIGSQKTSFGVDSAGNVGTQWCKLGAQPTMSNPTIASSTIYQNTTYGYQTIDIPCYATTAGTAGTVAVAYGTSSTPSTIYTQYVSGSTSSTAQAVIHLRVPPQWYYELTASGVTLGTPTMIQE